MFPQNKQYTYSASLTALIWFVFFALIFFVPLQMPKEQTTYTTVQLTLAPIESQQKAQSQSPAQPEKKPQQQNFAQTNQSTVAEQKPQQQLAPDLTSGKINVPAQNTPRAQKTAEFPDESQWVTFSSAQNEPKPEPAVTQNVRQFEGSVSETATNTQTATQATSSGRSGQNQNVSQNVSQSLSRVIAAQSFTQTAGEQGVSSESVFQTVKNSAGDGVEIQLRDGTTRRLIEPKEPKIILSPESEKLISASWLVRIDFRVLKDGTVPLSGISFSPAALLPPLVQEEIRIQIARWRFENAQSDGQAGFQYSIKKEN